MSPRSADGPVGVLRGESLTGPTRDHANRTKAVRRKRRIIWGAAALAAVVAALAQTEILLITSERNGEIGVSSYALREDDFNNSRLRLLRTRERLDEVVAGA